MFRRIFLTTSVVITASASVMSAAPASLAAHGPAGAGGGGKLAFIRNGDVYTANANGSGVHRLTHFGAGAAHPRWSPDGSRLAFGVSDQDSNKNAIYLINADGSNLHVWRRSPGIADPTWSPDGKRLAFSMWSSDRCYSNTAIDEIIAAAPVSAPRQTIAVSGCKGVDPTWEFPDWAPSGQYILADNNYYGGSGSGNILTLINTSTSRVRELYRSSCDFTWCDPAYWYDQGRFSPNGSNIVIRGQYTQGSTPWPARVIVMTSDGKNRHVVSPDNNTSNPTFTRDGRSILYTQSSAEETQKVIRRVTVAAPHKPVTILQNAEQVDQRP